MTYALTPKDSPFTDIIFDRRGHDLRGYQRRFDRHDAVEAGVALGIADTPASATAVGYLVGRYSDSFLPNVSAGSSPMRWLRPVFGGVRRRAARPGLVA
jgi:hypothetical protein